MEFSGKVIDAASMQHHKHLHKHSACKFICGQIGLNFGMQNLMKKVSVHCEFALETLS